MVPNIRFRGLKLGFQMMSLLVVVFVSLMVLTSLHENSSRIQEHVTDLHRSVKSSILGAGKESSYRIETYPPNIDILNHPIEELKYTKVQVSNNLVNDTSSTLLILSTISGSGSFGPKRDFGDFFKFITGFNYPRNQTSLALAFKEEADFRQLYNFALEYYKNQTEDVYNEITLLIAPFIEKDLLLNRGLRHNLQLQKQRRRTIARSRNFLINNALKDEPYTLSVDCDILNLPADSVNWFIDSEKDIVVPRIRQGSNPDYDGNSWAGPRTRPTDEEFLKLDESNQKASEFTYIPHHTGDTKRLAALMKQSISENSVELSKYLVQLDSVGGGVLFAKSEIYKQGIQFPPFYLIGSEWTRFEGFDGIETEGLCYQLRTIGYSCWGMPMVVGDHSFE